MTAHRAASRPLNVDPPVYDYVEADPSVPSIWDVVTTTAWIFAVALGGAAIAGLLVGSFIAGLHLALSLLT